MKAVMTLSAKLTNRLERRRIKVITVGSLFSAV
jgi:hypothetical protein